MVQCVSNPNLSTRLVCAKSKLWKVISMSHALDVWVIILLHWDKFLRGYLFLGTLWGFTQWGIYGMPIERCLVYCMKGFNRFWKFIFLGGRLMMQYALHITLYQLSQNMTHTYNAWLIGIINTESFGFHINAWPLPPNFFSVLSGILLFHSF